jgi:pyruvate, water dikinase
MEIPYDSNLSSGLPGLDLILKAIIPGDNIVWQVDTADQYRRFVEPYADFARKTGKNLIYFRFSRHEPLVGTDSNTQIHTLQPERGFEFFINEIHRVIKQNGRGGYYIFDSLSDLADSWFSDQMLGNFFMLTCPYLYDVEAIAYFGLYRHYHSPQASNPINDTAQVFLDVYQHKEHLYIYPVKVQHRFSPTMYMLHAWQDGEFLPITDSATISDVLTAAPRAPLAYSGHEPGVWNRTFLDAEHTLNAILAGGCPEEKINSTARKLIRTAFSRDDRIAGMIEKYLTLGELIRIGRRIVGTGLIGGKSVGMLLARAILEKTNPRWRDVLETHDSFYLGSDVFYTFLVKNGIWWDRQRQKDTENFLEGSARARHRMLIGAFPDYIEKQLSDLLDYFGQFPFIVRSSSLLEDNFGNAFAGKYESVFCVNQGPRSKRLEDFKTAIKTIYASAMSEKALTYRAQRDLLEHDEQMALLIQRVSGAFYDRLFLPQIAGVGFSYNPYVWHETIDPYAGVLRLVLGLGTRAVNAREDDYTRIVALNEPLKRPEPTRDEREFYTQKKIDVLDLDANQIVHYDISDLAAKSPRFPLSMFARQESQSLERAAAAHVPLPFCWSINFDSLLTRTGFTADLQAMLRTIEKAYEYPVDIEFTCNYFNENDYKINLVQCRPFQVKGGGEIPALPENLSQAEVILKARGAVIGPSRVSPIDCFVYVVPTVYAELPLRRRYDVARLIGRLMHVPNLYANRTIMLIGPGRWGTSSPELGVPIQFSEINTISVLCEVVAMREDLIPDVSLGTHLFSEMVEMDILYLALFPKQEDNVLNRNFLEKASNHLTDFVPDAAEFADVLRVVLPDGHPPQLHADTLKQFALCYQFSEL